MSGYQHIYLMASPLTPRFISNACMCLAVRKAARSMARQYDEALRHLGITSGQFSILVAVSAEPPMGVGKLADALGMDRTTLTAGLKPLERDGLILGQADPDDGRSRWYRLTQNGRAVLDAAYPMWMASQSEVEKRIGSANFDRLRREIRALA